MSTPSVTDYDLHGIVGVRVWWSKRADEAAVDRLLGPIRKPLSRDPDIVIRFCDGFDVRNLRVAEKDCSVFDDENFYLVRSGKRACIPFEQIGSRCEIVCESGICSVPLLLELIEFAAFGKGYVPIHASAFVYSRRGVVVTGWSKGGKTETLLAFAQHGAAYIGDECILLSGDGKHAFGVPGPIRLWPWHARQLPTAASHVPRRRRALWHLVRALDGLEQQIHWRRLRGLMPAIHRELTLFEVQPQQLFAPLSVQHIGRFDTLILTMSTWSADVELKPADAPAIAACMTASFQRELDSFMQHYFAFRFAFPERRNRTIDTFPEQHQRRLDNALQGKEAWVLLHSYPPVLTDLFSALAPVLDQATMADAEQESCSAHTL